MGSYTKDYNDGPYDGENDLNLNEIRFVSKFEHFSFICFWPVILSKLNLTDRCGKPNVINALA